VLLGVDRTFDANDLYAATEEEENPSRGRTESENRRDSLERRTGMDVTASKAGAVREKKEVVVYVDRGCTHQDAS